MVGTVISSSDAGRVYFHSEQTKSTNQQLTEASRIASTGLLGGYDKTPDTATDSQLRKIENEKIDTQNDIFLKLQKDVDKIWETYNHFHQIMSEYNARIKNYMSTKGDPSFQLFCNNSLVEVENKLNDQSSSGFYYFGGVGAEKPVVSLKNVPRPELNESLNPADYSNYKDPPKSNIIDASGISVEIPSRYDSEDVRAMIHALLIGVKTPPNDNPDSSDYQQLAKGAGLAIKFIDTMKEVSTPLNSYAILMSDTESENGDIKSKNLTAIKEYDTEFFITSWNRFQEKMNQLKLQQGIAMGLSNLLKDQIDSIRMG